PMAGQVIHVGVALEDGEQVDGRHHQRGAVAGDDGVALLPRIHTSGQAREAGDVRHVGGRGRDQGLATVTLQRPAETLGLMGVRQLWRSVPATWPAPSVARAATASATAVTGTQPFGSTSGIAERLAGVSIVLGATALTVTPWPLTSWASACMSAMTPAF